MQKAKSLFIELSDQVMGDWENQRVISFKSFALGCVMNNIFSLATQLAFLGVKNKSDCKAKLKSMLPEINSRFLVIEERFQPINKYEQFYKKWIDHIKKAISRGDNIPNPNVVLIQLSLIEAESIRSYAQYYKYISSYFIDGDYSP